jgi:DNA-directed RNA polymerase subunit RPC12/RpoP
MEKRLPFKCWNCNRKYTLFKEITKEQELIVQCPYCEAEAVAKLKPYERKTKTVLRGDDEDEHSVGYEYEFPEVIPTEKPE